MKRPSSQDVARCRLAQACVLGFWCRIASYERRSGEHPMQVLWSRSFEHVCRIDVEVFVEDRGLRERTECVHERWAWSLSALNDSDDRPKQVFHDEGAIERLDGHGQPPLSKSRPQSLPKGVGCQYRPQVGHASKSKRRYCGFPVEILPSVLGPRMARLK